MISLYVCLHKTFGFLQGRAFATLTYTVNVAQVLNYLLTTFLRNALNPEYRFNIVKLC